MYWSEQSWDEMSLGSIEYTLDKQDLSKAPNTTANQQQ